MAVTFRDYTTISLTGLTVLGLIISFSGGVWNVYGGQANSQTIEKIQEKTQNTVPQEDRFLNKSSSAQISDSSFSSADLFGLATGFVGGIASIPAIFATALGELGLPSELIYLASIPVFIVVWELFSMVQGVRT